MDRCSEMQELISRMLDEELSEREQKELNEHLAHCEECRSLYEAFADVSSILREDLVEPPESLYENVMGEVRRDAMIKRNRRRIRGFVTAAAAVLLIAAGLRAMPAGKGLTAASVTAAMPGEAVFQVAGTESVRNENTAAEAEMPVPEPAAAQAAETEEAALSEAFEESAMFDEAAPVGDVSLFAAAAAPVPDREPAAAPAADSDVSSEAFTSSQNAAASSARAAQAVNTLPPVLDLSAEMSLSKLTAFLDVETADGTIGAEELQPVRTVLVSDGALSLFESEGELYCFDYITHELLHVRRSLGEIEALG